MRHMIRCLIVVAMGVAVCAPRAASAQQTLQLTVGAFAPASLDQRVRDGGDVIANNLDFLSFDPEGFTGPSVGAEWILGLGMHVEAGLSVSGYQKTVPSVYTRLVSPSGRDIPQDLRLRQMPVAATLRWLPFGQTTVQPYLGVGIAAVRWNYREAGDFVDPVDRSIFSDSFTVTGTSAAPVAMLGVRVPVGSLLVGGELRGQGGQGTLPRNQGFSSRRIDLSGGTAQLTVGVRF